LIQKLHAHLIAQIAGAFEHLFARPCAIGPKPNQARKRGNG
jgi:hypothetical protein